MTDSLFQAYLPLILWPGLGLILFRLLPEIFPRFLGRSLYWVGVPLEIFSLIRRAEISSDIGLTPVITVAALVLGWGLAQLSWQLLQLAQVSVLKPLVPEVDWSDRALQGSFTLASMIGNTGFVGLAIAPAFVSDRYLSWIVFYSVAHNIIGSYGVGVLVASTYGRADLPHPRWQRLKDVLTVPSLWAMILSLSLRSVSFPAAIEQGLVQSVWVIIPAALVLLGMRLSQLQNWTYLGLALVPSLIKVVLVPAGTGLLAIALGLPQPACLALVLMSGMPSAFAGLILAEEYDLNRDLMTLSIALTTGLLLGILPLWIYLFNGY
ncbi:MAG: AEC family transporter [Leptolyngbyaceae cyanobacterium SL_1_1]|nr:AEC family transporter [Leptolyngbyaceae cyanobacterium RM1_1_2]NJO09145.1 AEC family transporter [Leptolyngbyaceae cyanobacterium SL_1_1]